MRTERQQTAMISMARPRLRIEGLEFEPRQKPTNRGLGVVEILDKQGVREKAGSSGWKPTGTDAQLPREKFRPRASSSEHFE